LLTYNAGLSTLEFWDKFFADNAPDCLTKFYASRGEKKISCTEWSDQVDQAKYEGLKVKRVRTMDLEFNVVGKPFVSVAPTERSFKLIEHSSTKIVFRVLSRARDIPYCDTFGIDEEWYIASPSATAKSCVLRVSVVCNFYKFSIMKSIIRSGAESDSTAVMQGFAKHMSDMGLDFAEKKRPPPQAKIQTQSTKEAEKVEDKEDYTTEQELQALFEKQPVKAKDAVVYVQVMIGMSVDDFYKAYL
jgi:hypothetical protein